MKWNDARASAARTRWEIIQEMRAFEQLDNTSFSRNQIHRGILVNDSILFGDARMVIDGTNNPPTPSGLSYRLDLNYPKFQQRLFFFTFLADLYRVYSIDDHYVLHNTAFYDAMDYQLDHSLVFDKNQIKLFVPREQHNKDGLMRLLLGHDQQKVDWSWTL